MVNFPAKQRHCPLTDTTIYSLVIEAQGYKQNAQIQCPVQEYNLRPLYYMSNS